MNKNLKILTLTETAKQDLKQCFIYAGFNKIKHYDYKKPKHCLTISICERASLLCFFISKYATFYELKKVYAIITSQEINSFYCTYTNESNIETVCNDSDEQEIGNDLKDISYIYAVPKKDGAIWGVKCIYTNKIIRKSVKLEGDDRKYYIYDENFKYHMNKDNKIEESLDENYMRDMKFEIKK